MPRVPVNLLLLGTTLLATATLDAGEPAEVVARDLPNACQQAFSSVGPDRYGEVLRSCEGFIEEILGTAGSPAVVTFESGKGVVTGNSFCLPVRLGHFYVAKTLVEWAQLNPEKLKGRLGAGLVAVIEEAYPCEGPWDPDAMQSDLERSVLSGERIPDRCPLCGSKKVQEILYGLPGDDFDATQFASGGCFVGNGDSRWHCAECFHMWGLLDADRYYW